MALTFPDDLPVDWEDDVGMPEDASFLNAVGGMSNTLKAILIAFFQGTERNYVTTNEVSTSAAFAALPTAGEATVTVGGTGIVLAIMRCQWRNAATAIQYMGCELSGANTEVAVVEKSISMRQPFASSTAFYNLNGIIPYSGLSPGDTTFKTRFATSSGSCTFQNRELFLIPFP